MIRRPHVTSPSLRAARALERRAVWIFGAPRSGTTWLLGMLRADPDVVAVNEPGIGGHLGLFATGVTGLAPGPDPVPALRVNDLRAGDPDYFFDSELEAAWLPGLRSMLLSWLWARTMRSASRRGIAKPIPVLKEPNGAEGADLLIKATPGSRVIFLLRDGRDVVDSNLDSASRGAWATRTLRGFAPVDGDDRMRFIADRAHAWVARISTVQRALRAHSPARQYVLRYEDLRAEPAVHLSAIAGWLNLSLDAGATEELAAKLAFERIPQSRRGPGEFARAATPGLWKRNLSPPEQALCEAIMGEKLRELGYE